MPDNLKKIKELTETLNKVELNLVSENQTLTDVLDNTLDGYWDWNIVTNYEYLSPSWKNQLGYSDSELENSTSTWMKLIHPDDLSDALQQFADHVKSKGKSKFEVISRYTHKLGHTVDILCRGCVCEWDNDKPVRMVGVHIDITDLIKKFK